MRPALSVLVLSEDGSRWAFATMQALARKLLPFIDRHTATHRVRFEPGDKAREGVRANRWKSKNPRDRPAIVDLRRELATKVLEDEVPGYVLFHFDGDRRWSEADASENARDFEEFRRSLTPLIEHGLRRRAVPTDEAAIEARLRRICPVVPFYSVESWLYQNTAKIREACQRSCGQHLELIDRWEHDRSLLDEVPKPKTKLCVGSSINASLAESLTSELADRLYETEQSFHATIERLGSCPGIAEALAGTWSTNA